MGRKTRINAIKVLYSAELSETSITDALATCDIEDFTDDSKELLTKIENNLEQIDEVISSSLQNYTINRLNLVDKAIIRVAVSELLFGDLDKRIIINEALEITKEYSDLGDHKAVSFNNRLLDNICKTLKK